MKHLSRWAFALIVLINLLTAAGFTQSAGTGAISGTITDASGAVVPDATIKAIDVATGEVRSVVSASNGTYLVPLLNPGTYRVQVNKTGFKQMLSATFPVHVTETAGVNLQLEVGSTSETVTVTGVQKLLKTEDATLGQVVDQKEMESLPLVTRNYTQILGLSAGVSAEVFNAAEIGRGGLNDGISSGGSNWVDNNYQMNGVEINDREASGYYSGGTAIPNPDSIQEFKVQTSQYDASSGRNSGANVDVVTKGGTNQWHGSAWEYFRNEDMNANTFFNNETGQPRGRLRQNQFGFALGGPIRKDKLLFFTSYQGTRQQNGVDTNCSSSAILPLLTGDRSDTGLEAAVGAGTVWNGVDFLGVPVALTGVSSQALALFQYKLPNGQYLIPNPQIIKNVTIVNPLTGAPSTGPAGFSSFSQPCTYNEDQFITNLDWLQSQKSSFQGRFFFSNSNSVETLTNAGASTPVLPGSPQTNPLNYRNFSLSHTYIFTNHLVNQAEIAFHRTYATATPQPAFTWSDLGVTAPSFDNADPYLEVFGGMIAGGGQIVGFVQNTFIGQDTLSWTHGRQNIRIGASVDRGQINDTGFTLQSEAIFLDFPSLLQGPLPPSLGGGPLPLTPYETADLPGLTARGWRTWTIGGFVQDDIKLTSRLTVNVGLRYERLGDPGDHLGRNSTIDPSLLNPNPPAAGSLAGFVVSSNYPGTPPAGVVSSGNSFGIKGEGQNTINPRIGFAWALPNSDRAVLRGGYGVYHQTITGQPFFQEIADQPFAVERITVNPPGGFASPFQGDPGAFPQWIPYIPTTNPLQLLSPYFLDRSLRPPTLQKYSLTLQTQIAKDLALEVGYSGGRYTHLLLAIDPNQAALASVANPIRGETTSTLENIQLRVPYEGFSSSQMTQLGSFGSGWYNGLQVSLNKRFSHGLQFLASYTWARDLTNVIGGVGGPYAFTSGLLYGDQTNARRDYGPDNFVRPQRFVFSAVYDLPGPNDRHSALGYALAGWKLSGVATIQSGQLLTPYNGAPASNIYGVLTDFANFTPGCALATSGSTFTRVTNRWINAGCEAPYPAVGPIDPILGVAPTGFGNGGVGVVVGPGQSDTDLSLNKLFPLSRAHEAMNLEFRTDAFNVFNHPIFSNPDVTVTDASFGQITTLASNPRILQLSLRFSF
jgi:hypothetical protein